MTEPITAPRSPDGGVAVTVPQVNSIGKPIKQKECSSATVKTLKLLFVWIFYVSGRILPRAVPNTARVGTAIRLKASRVRLVVTVTTPC